MKLSFFTMIAALALVACFPSAHAEVNVGEPAPDFIGVDSNGNEHKLSDFIGKTVVLEWSNHECPYVVKHYESGNMQKLQQEATATDTVWLTIVSSAEGKQGHTSAEEAKQVIEEVGAASTARILDPSGEIGQLYGAKTTPHMFVVNAEGILVYAGAIDSDSSHKQEAIEGATNYVRAALNSLQAGTEIEVASTKPYGCSVKY